MSKIILHLLICAAVITAAVFGFRALRAAYGTDNNLTSRQSFLVLRTATGKAEEISAVDYVAGCLAAQISPDCHIEALKAQAAAVYTYALRICRDNELYPSRKLMNADFSDDPARYQAYVPFAAAVAEYGKTDGTADNADEYKTKLTQAAEYGITRIITYGGEPIYAAWHAVSNGRTNESRYVWGRELPYLKSVNSNWDKDAPDYYASNQFTADSVRSMLQAADQSAQMPLDYALWFRNTALTDGGYVAGITVGDTVNNGILAVRQYSGGDLWRILRLRSTAFDITYTGSVFEVHSCGRGHGAGMSQYGADYMARQGYDAEYILKYYYTGVAVG